MMRKSEFFEKMVLRNTDSISAVPPKLFHQERDWTCSIACIRTLLSAIEETVPAEDEFVEKYGLVPGPHYSRDIKKLNLLEGYDVIYGCDDRDDNFDDILDMMKQGYYIMLESMVNYSHWLVLLGYFASADTNDIEKTKLLFFDPYYNELKLLNTEEFIGMWIDGNYAVSKVKHDYIAIKKQEK